MRVHRSVLVVLGAVTFAAACVPTPEPPPTTTSTTTTTTAPPRPTIERLSVAPDGSEGNGDAEMPAISADGRYVAFGSRADNLVPGDTNGHADVFVRDRVSGVTSLVSVASDGTPANGGSYDAAVSADGRHVAFVSVATNLAPADPSPSLDVYVHDRTTGETSLVSMAADGSASNFGALLPSLSSDGSIVTFESGSSNLVPGDTNGVPDVFVHDRVTGDTTRVSVSSDGVQGDDASDDAAISGDGRYVSFGSEASNLVAVDLNAKSDIFVHDRVTGSTTLVSAAPDGTEADGNSYESSLSEDGRFVGFLSHAGNLVTGDDNLERDMFVHDRVTGSTVRVSIGSDGAQGNFPSSNGVISGDGRHVTFASPASTFVPGDTNATIDVFTRDLDSGVTTRVSVSPDGVQGDDFSSSPALSADGRYVAFHAWATTLVPGDTNGERDVFLHDRGF